MTEQDQKRAAARRAVSERLRRFIAALAAQLSEGTAELWAKVEGRLANKPPSTEPAQNPAGESTPHPVPPQRSQTGK